MRVTVLALASGALLHLGCKSRTEEAPPSEPNTASKPPPPEVQGGKPVRRGELQRNTSALFDVLVPPGAQPEPCETAAKAAAKERGFAIESQLAPTKKTVVVERSTTEKIGWSGGERYIDASAMSKADRDRFDKSTAAISISATTVGRDRKLALDTAAVARAAAGACKGWIIDPQLMRVVPVEDLTMRVPGETFDARKMMVIHQVAGENDLDYLDTNGLERIGLPELLLADVPKGYARIASEVLDATAQTLANQGDLLRDGELDVDVSKLAGWDLEVYKQAGGNGVIRWKVRWATPDKEQHGAPMLELYVAGSTAGEPVALLSAFEQFAGGEKDHVERLDFQPELDAAAVKARAALTALRPRFAKGIPTKERLSIKAPFRTDAGGNEWMWVEVYRFQGDKIEGTLANTPEQVSGLQLGARVKVKLGEVADFIHRRSDGNTGGYSFDVMRAHGIDVPPLSEL